jgi:hypothetical protein
MKSIVEIRAIVGIDDGQGRAPLIERCGGTRLSWHRSASREKKPSLVDAGSSLPKIAAGLTNCVSSNPQYGECANAIRPRSALSARNNAARNIRVRTRNRRSSRALVPPAQRQAGLLPPGRRPRGRPGSHDDAIGRLPPSGSQPHQLQQLRQPRG